METARPESLLPSIKCSSCAKEIHISTMGDHVCASLPERKPSRRADLLGKMVERTISRKAASPQKSGKLPLPKIDSTGANVPFLNHNSSNGNIPQYSYYDRNQRTQYSETRSAQPASGGPVRPPSPQYSSNLDCAFPVFPSPSPALEPGYKYQKSSQYLASGPSAAAGRRTPSPMRSRINDRRVSPGPPSSRGGDPIDWKDNVLGPDKAQKSATFEDPAKPWLSSEDSVHQQQRPSSARENRRPMLGEELPRTDTIDAFLAKLKGGSSPQPRKRQDELGQTGPKSESRDAAAEKAAQKSMIGKDTPLPSIPKQENLTTLSGYPPYQPPSQKQSSPQRAHESPQRSLHRRGTSSDTTPRSRYPPRSSSKGSINFYNHPKDEPKLPPLPLPTTFKPSSSSHHILSPQTPTDSSSEESIGSFDTQASGSLSSPATSVASSRSAKRSNWGSGEESAKYAATSRFPAQPFRQASRPDPDVQIKLNDFSFGGVATTSAQACGASAPAPTNGYHTSPERHDRKPSTVRFDIEETWPTPARMQASQKLRDIVSEKVINKNNNTLNGSAGGNGNVDPLADPAVQHGLLRKMSMAETVTAAMSQPKPKSGHNQENSSFSLGWQENGSPTMYRCPPAKSPAGYKSDCRGCGQAIVGKSVKAADGTLSGRFHKQCFVCHHCHSPFQTADFYVLRDSPYCERHYHELNDSLCHFCDCGIEGQYLETDEGKKYHSQCFTCLDCPTVLKDDYYEVNGKAYCERHAFQGAGSGSDNNMSGGYGGDEAGFLGVGPRRNVEKRRTRLMMM